MPPPKFLIVMNESHEGPGLLEAVLKECRIAFDVADLDRGDAFPDPTAYAALAVLGGADSANDDSPKMKAELLRVREAVDKGVPYLGVCLGMQVLVKACGGEVLKHSVKETGWRDAEGGLFEAEFTPAGLRDPLFSGLKPPLRVFQLHGETVRLTPAMTLLARGRTCENQIVRISGKIAYGIQSHIELTADMLERWADEDQDLKRLDRRKLTDDHRGMQAEYEAAGRRILTNFLEIAGLAYL